MAKKRIVLYGLSKCEKTIRAMNPDAFDHVKNEAMQHLIDILKFDIDVARQAWQERCFLEVREVARGKVPFVRISQL